MKGWKTWAAAGILGVAAALEALGYNEWSKILMTVGGALGLVGVAHKIEKAAKSQG